MKKLLFSIAAMTSSSWVIYVTVGKGADAKPEFTQVVR